MYESATNSTTSTCNIPMIRICETYIERTLLLNIEHKNPETRQTRLLCFRYKTFFFIIFEFKRLFDIRTEIPSYYADFSVCPKPCVEPATRPRWASESQPSSPGGKTQLTDFFSNSPRQILRARFRCMTSFTSPSHNFLTGIFILTSLNDTSAPRARVNTCAQVCT